MEPSRRSFIIGGAAAAATATATTLLPQAADASAPAARRDPRGHGRLADGFTAPPVGARPWFRYWIPGASVGAAEIRNEVATMAAAGFGGLELTDLPKSGVTVTDATEFGSDAWVAIVTAALDEARKHGMHASLLIGPSWPATASTIDVDSLGAAQELVTGTATVAGGTVFDGTLPAPTAAADGVARQQLVALLAYRSTTDSVPTTSPISLDQDTYVDLTARAKGTGTGATLRWQAPSTGTWVLIAFWSRGTGETKEDGRFVVVDHFSERGVAPIKEMYAETILTRQVRSLLARVPTSIFEDSIELTGGSGQFWTADMLDQFEKRRGYSLKPYLPVIAQTGVGSFFGSPVSLFAFGTDADTRVYDDYSQTLSDCYLERHVYPLQAWAHSLGMTYKAQLYGTTPIDTTLAAATIDQPEGESLDDGVYYEKWRIKAGGMHLGNRPLMSCELAGTLSNSYGMTWGEDMLPMANGNYAGGVNRGIIHGFPAVHGPDDQWPGNDAFGGTTGENWGPRIPTWTHISDMSGFLARSQYLLQQGTPRIDLAVYRQELLIGYGPFSGNGLDTWSDTGLVRAGYTYDYQSQGSLLLPEASVAGGVLGPKGPRYRALILDDEEALPLPVARRMLAFAKAGLPVVVVGQAPSRTKTYHRSKQQDAALVRTIAALLRQHSVTRVSSEADVPAHLASRGILPAASYAAPSAGIVNTRRSTAEGDLYFFTNVATTEQTVITALAGDGVPYTFDAFSGAISRRPGSRQAVTVSLAPGDSTAVLLAGSRAYSVPESAPLPAASAPTATSLAIEKWRLVAQSWVPGATPYETDKVTSTHDLDALVPWTRISGLEDASGVGTYTSTVTLAGPVPDAVLDLGTVTDTFRIWVNGRRLPPQDVVDTRVRCGSHLHKGANTITVQVATPLLNAVRVARQGEWLDRAKGDYGLIGPVVLRQYSSL